MTMLWIFIMFYYWQI